MFRKVFSPMNVKVVMPAPPTSSDSQKWFDLEDLSWSKVIGGSCATEADLSVLEQIDAGAAKVAKLVEQEANDVYVSGFAQGGCVALYSALCRARTAGAMSLGGPPVRVEVLKAKAPSLLLRCGSFAARTTRPSPSSLARAAWAGWPRLCPTRVWWSWRAAATTCR